jgi:hypothetical protein
MADLTIYLGNKNYSSWSLRPWLVLKRITVEFDEVVIPLYQPTSRETVLKYSPSGRVPALRHGGVTVWESLAICAAKPGVPSRTGISSNAMPAWRSSSQGRSDQEE